MGPPEGLIRHWTRHVTGNPVLEVKVMDTFLWNFSQTVSSRISPGTSIVAVCCQQCSSKVKLCWPNLRRSTRSGILLATRASIAIQQDGTSHGKATRCLIALAVELQQTVIHNFGLVNKGDYIWYFVNTPVPSVNYCDELDRCILYCILFVFMPVSYTQSPSPRD